MYWNPTAYCGAFHHFDGLFYNFVAQYPIVHVLPLSVGRMASADDGNTPCATYSCVVGAPITLPGLYDTALYAISRKRTVLEPKTRSERKDNCRDLF